MKAFYQNASIGECCDIQFMGQMTLFPQHDSIATGWKVTVNRQSSQVYKFVPQ